MVNLRSSRLLGKSSVPAHYPSSPTPTYICKQTIQVSKRIIGQCLFVVVVLKECRVKYNQQHYKDVFTEENYVSQIDDSVNEPSLLELVEVSDNAILTQILPNKNS